MLLRHILGFAPSNLVPALVSFAIIYVFTRLLAPANYGVYALVYNVAFISQGILAFWLRTGSTRFYDKAQKEGTLAPLISTMYRSYGVSVLLFASLYAVLMLAFPVSEHLRTALWLGLPFIVIKGFVTVNLGVHRGAGRIARYNMLECGQTVIGLIFSIVLVFWFGMKEDGILLGLIGGSLLAAILDIPLVLRSIRPAFDRAQFKLLATFGAPLTVSVILNLVLSTSDRILIEYYLGSAPVGIYSVSYGIVNQPMMLIFLAVSMPGLPLAIRALELHGTTAAREQMGRNGVALFALGIPACVGLIAVMHHLAAVLIGEEYRADALEIMPWIAISGFLAGLQAHYFDHAFTLGRRPKMLIRSIGLAAAVNVALNIILLPRIGLMGAVYATFISYIVAIGASVYFGRDVFRVPFPREAALKAMLAAVPMWVVLSQLRFPETLPGLLGMVICGGATYVAAAFVLNIGDARKKLWQRLVRGQAA